VLLGNKQSVRLHSYRRRRSDSAVQTRAGATINNTLVAIFPVRVLTGPLGACWCGPVCGGRCQAGQEGASSAKSSWLTKPESAYYVTKAGVN
jgi:hypothetical protein